MGDAKLIRTQGMREQGVVADLSLELPPRHQPSTLGADLMV